jgi:hypothetical protein
MVLKRNTCSTICGLVMIVMIFFVFGTILFSNNCNKYVSMSCDDKKIYCDFNNYTINSDSCDAINDDDDDIVSDGDNCYDLILNCTYTKQNQKKYCEIILIDFLNNESAIDYFNQNFYNKTNIAYLYNNTQCTLDPVYENENITTFGLTLIILGFLVISIYMYIMRNVFLDLCLVKVNTKYELKKYKNIDINDSDEEPPKYTE